MEAAEKKVDVVKTIFEHSQPLRRSGLPEDVAQAALWLASDDSSFVNGHALVVDGGLIGGRIWSDYLEAINQLRSAMGLDRRKNLDR